MAVVVEFQVTEPPNASVYAGLQCEAAYVRLPLDQPAVRPASSVPDPARCGTSLGARLDVTSAIRAVPAGQWGTLEVPLACFAQQGADLSNVQAPLIMETSGQLGLSISRVTLRRATRDNCDATQLLRSHHVTKTDLSAAAQ
jgi:hypothetical protein